MSIEKNIQEEIVYNLALKIFEKLGVEQELKRKLVQVNDEYVGPGYSLPTDSMVEAVNILAKTEGILLDPVYSSKAMAGLIGLVRKGKFKKDDNVLFVHTGGSPALYAYIPTILNK